MFCASTGHRVAAVFPAWLEEAVCACADDIEVRRHWAPGSLTTDAQTLGFPTRRGVLQTGAATHTGAWRPMPTSMSLQTVPHAEKLFHSYLSPHFWRQSSCRFPWCVDEYADSCGTLLVQHQQILEHCNACHAKCTRSKTRCVLEGALKQRGD